VYDGHMTYITRAVLAVEQSERNAECENCHGPIFRNSVGGFTHVGNTTSIPTTCYTPDGAQTTGRPAGYIWDTESRTWERPDSY
jgi:hypothetical protein